MRISYFIYIRVFAFNEARPKQVKVAHNEEPTQSELRL